MTHLLSWTSLGAALSLLACSGNDAVPGGMGGASGAAAGGSAGAMAGLAGSAGMSGGVGGSASGTAGNSGSGGGAQAGAATGGTAGAGGAGGAAGSGGSGGAAAPFVLTSPAFDHVEACTNDNKAACTELFPPENVMMSIGGENKSPELNWGAGPLGTMSYVMCLHDTSNGNTHWCLWNIPAATRQLPANLARQKMPAAPAGSSQDSFSGADDGYMGPGAKGNVYQFRLYALNAATYTPPDDEDRETVYDELEADPDNVVLGMTTLRGRSNPN